VRADDVESINKQIEDSTNRLKMTLKNMASSMGYKEVKDDDNNGNKPFLYGKSYILIFRVNPEENFITFNF